MAPGLSATAIKTAQRISNQTKSLCIEISIAVGIKHQENKLKPSFHWQRTKRGCTALGQSLECLEKRTGYTVCVKQTAK